MIVTKTPLRISLFGGGTDLPGFCSHSTGRVLTGAINQYIYVVLKKRFDGKTRVCYSQTEFVDDPALLKHDIIRSVLVKAKVRGVDIATFSDVPPNGTGLGTSSALAVGVIQAVYALRGIDRKSVV
jgi:D-glycero-alpha-D-manno-heptose-7-phosphate kinase